MKGDRVHHAMEYNGILPVFVWRLLRSDFERTSLSTHALSQTSNNFEQILWNFRFLDLKVRSIWHWTNFLSSLALGSFAYPQENEK